MEQRTIDDGELRQWIDEWGEESHDDILPSDDEADIANRILEHHTRGEYPDDVDWNGAWESLQGIVGPALEHVHGFFPDGAETLARYVREIDMGMLACERGMPVRFFTASSLVMRLRRARDENRLDAELRAIGRARLLVIDELGYLPIDIDGARLLFQVVADSYEKRSVVFTTNLEFGRWGEVFGDGDMAAAVIDRIVHHGRIVRFRGESYRNSHSLMK